MMQFLHLLQTPTGPICVNDSLRLGPTSNGAENIFRIYLTTVLFELKIVCISMWIYIYHNVSWGGVICAQSLCQHRLRIFNKKNSERANTIKMLNIKACCLPENFLMMLQKKIPLYRQKILQRKPTYSLYYSSYRLCKQMLNLQNFHIKNHKISVKIFAWFLEKKSGHLYWQKCAKTLTPKQGFVPNFVALRLSSKSLVYKFSMGVLSLFAKRWLVAASIFTFGAGSKLAI